MVVFGFALLVGVVVFVLLSEHARRRSEFALRPLRVDRDRRSTD
jgi:hypothetical protein